MAERTRRDARRETLEAMAYMVLARLLVARVRFARWRRWLGPIMARPAVGTGSVTLADHRLARSVERAAARLPFETLCLVRAMALHRMLARRGRPSILAIAVLPDARRGSIDDLHAWVELGDHILIGASDEPYHVLIRFSAAKDPDCD